MSEQTSPGSDPDEVEDTAGGSEKEAGNLTVEDDPQGTHDPADLAGSGDSGDDAVE